MDPEISPKQTLFLWRLLAQPEGMFVGKSKPELSSAERKQLVEAGLVKVEKRKAVLKTRGADYAVLTEMGWNWAEHHLDAPLPKKGDAALIVLHQVFELLKVKIDAGEISLGRLFASSELATKPTGVIQITNDEQFSDAIQAIEDAPLRHASSDLPMDVKQRLYNACFQISGDGVYGVRIRLAELRSKLADVPRPELDNALRDLERTEAAAIMPLDDPREILPVDEAAALSNSQGKKRHILYLSRPR